MTTYKDDIGCRVRELRKDKNLSQQELANIIGCNKSFICRLEKGKENITIEKLNDICIAFDISFSFFFGPLDRKK